MPAQYERFDTCYGIIEGKSKYGIYLILITIRRLLHTVIRLFLLAVKSAAA